MEVEIDTKFGKKIIPFGSIEQRRRLCIFENTRNNVLVSGWGSRFHGPIRCAGQQMQEICQEQPNLGLHFLLSAVCYDEDQWKQMHEPRRIGIPSGQSH